VNPDNLHILVDHVKCAAFELPFTAQESFGQDAVETVLEVLAEEGFVHRAGDSGTGRGDAYPADAVSCGRSPSTTS